MFWGKLPKFCMEKGIKRIFVRKIFFPKKLSEGGGGVWSGKCPSNTPYWSGKTSSPPPPNRSTEVSALILRSRACTFTVGCSHCHIQKSLQITKTSFKVPEKRVSLVKKSMKKFPKSTRIRIVINTDELYNSSKFLHGAVSSVVSYNCKSK